VVGGEAGDAVTGPHGDATGGETGQHSRSVHDLQQQEVGRRRPDADPGQGGQGGGELLAGGGEALDQVGGVGCALVGPGGQGGTGQAVDAPGLAGGPQQAGGGGGASR
jgi:hypothetical protein